MCVTHISSFPDESLLCVENVFDASHQLQRTSVICALKYNTFSLFHLDCRHYSCLLTYPLQIIIVLTALMLHLCLVRVQEGGLPTYCFVYVFMLSVCSL